MDEIGDVFPKGRASYTRNLAVGGDVSATVTPVHEEHGAPLVAPMLTGGSSFNLAENGSVTPVVFEYEAAAPTYISAIRIFVEGGTPMADPTKFGGATLSNGMTLKVIDTDGTTVVADLAPAGIRSGNLWTSLGTQVIPAGATAATATSGSYVAEFAPFRVSIGQFVRLTVRDDMTGIGFGVAVLYGTVG